MSGCVGCALDVRWFASVRRIPCVGSASVFASVRRFCVGICVGKKYRSGRTGAGG
jgi:hypothetical protein